MPKWLIIQIRVCVYTYVYIYIYTFWLKQSRVSKDPLVYSHYPAKPSSAMLSRLLFASLLGVAVATCTETDKAKGVYNYLITYYTGDCFTGTVTAYDYRELGQCLPNSLENPSYYKMGEANATHYIGKRYTDAACTIEKVGAEIDVLPPPNTPGTCWTGNRSETTGTILFQDWSDSDCSTPSDVGNYHGDDVCEPDDSGTFIATPILLHRPHQHVAVVCCKNRRFGKGSVMSFFA